MQKQWTSAKIKINVIHIFKFCALLELPVLKNKLLTYMATLSANVDRRHDLSIAGQCHL